MITEIILGIIVFELAIIGGAVGRICEALQQIDKTLKKGLKK